MKDVEKDGEEECPSVRTTHAAPDYQEFTAPHSAYSLPWTCTVLTFCHILHRGTHYTACPILASTTSHSAKRDRHWPNIHSHFATTTEGLGLGLAPAAF